MRIAFVHPDLGIGRRESSRDHSQPGGAERLVVDAAVGLKQHQHDVVMWTSHHDPLHCFEETRDGTLEVRVVGDFLPRTFFGKGYLFFAILRSLCLSVVLVWQSWFLSDAKYDILIVDQLSASIPILRLTGAKILFYCHFPDKLLTQRHSVWKKLYRLPMDMLEELTTKMADVILVNSQFTAGIFKQSFPHIQKTPSVLYPSIRFTAYDQTIDPTENTLQCLKTTRQIILSINRFERKKNIELAIESFAEFLHNQPSFKDKALLVVSGGYDYRVVENVEYLKHLNSLASSLSLSTQIILPDAHTSSQLDSKTQVLFLASFNEYQRTYLLKNASCLLYTPSNEHFGIVPVEAMYAGLPVIAVNNGGPTESVIDQTTGFLCDPNFIDFAQAIQVLVLDKQRGITMGANGKKHVVNKFSLEAFVENLENTLQSLNQNQFNHKREGLWTTVLVWLVMGALPFFLMSLVQLL